MTTVPVLAEKACDLLDWQVRHIAIEELTPDGSLRFFCRLTHKDGRRRIVIAPPENDPAALKEAASGWNIGRHLFASNAPVPELYLFDKVTGLLICEDLGKTRLHDLLMRPDSDADYIKELYEQAVVQLARMQVRAFSGFKTQWCWDSPQYDRKVMLERESGYFLQSLCLDMLKLPVECSPVQEEMQQLADWAGRADSRFFLHRDFQSRNIMVKSGRVRFIDYQAGRSGPLGYDLASLLIDPYAALSDEVQQGLVDCYFNELTQLIPYERSKFQDEYLALSLQRNLQIAGAFAFLSYKRSKLFFRQYIRPALLSLRANLARVPKAGYPFLTRLVDQCLTDV